MKITLIVLIMCIAHTLTSQSLSLSDDNFAPLYNPASISFGNSKGLTFYGQYQDDLRTNNYMLWMNREHYSFLYGKFEGTDNYQISLSDRLFRNSYGALSLRWQNSNVGSGFYDISYLQRPTNWLSLGLKIEDVFNNDRPFGFGIAFRPFKLDGWSSLSLYSDFYFEKDNGDYASQSEIIGVQTNILPGVIINGCYDLKRESIGVNLSIIHNGLKIGNKMAHSSEATSGAYYVNISEIHYPSFPLFKKSVRYQEFDLKKEIVEAKEETKIGPFVIVRDQQTMRELIEDIGELRDDERINGIVLKNPKLLTNYANVEQLERTFNSFRETGKKVITYSNNYGNLHYAFLSAISDELYLNPNGAVNLQGFSINIPYFRELFDKIGVEMYDLKSHEFKTGFNMLTENEMTEAELITYNDLLEYMFEHMENMIERGRHGKLKTSAKEIINQGPYLSSQKAKNMGLVDKLIYEQEFEQLLKSRFDVDIISKRTPNQQFNTQWYQESKTKIAIINAVGGIKIGQGQPGRSIGSETLVKQIQRVRDDDSIAAVILRIESGGGSAFASDVIAREVKLLSESGKPVIASFAGIAASGGYYIAANADKIVSEGTTITGSIGVTGLIPNMAKMFDKLYINWNRVRVGDRAGLLDPFQPIDEQELTLLHPMIDEKYNQFLDIVSQGRQMSKDEVHEYAQGRVWVGKQAYDKNLVDEIGGLDTAIRLAKELIGADDVKISDFSHTHKKRSFAIEMDDLVRNRNNMPYISEIKHELKSYLKSFEDEPVQYRMPMIEIDGIE